MESDVITINIEMLVRPEYRQKEFPADINYEDYDDHDDYDDQTREDWYNFTGNVEGIVENLSNAVSVSFNDEPGNRSETISFQGCDSVGRQRRYRIDMRLSDSSRSADRGHNRKYAARYVLESITVNGQTCYSDMQALTVVRNLL